MDSDLTPLPSEGEAELAMPSSDPVALKPKTKKRKVAALFPEHGPSAKRSLRNLSSKIDGPADGPADEYLASRTSKRKARSSLKDDEELQTGKKQHKNVTSKYSGKRPQVEKKSIPKVGAGDITSDDDDAPAPKKARTSRRRVSKPEPVYIIPEVERRETSFKGRLGTLHTSTDKLSSLIDA